MATLTKSADEMIVSRAATDEEFRRSLLCEAAAMLANGEAGPARFVIADCVRAMGAEDAAAAATGWPAESVIDSLTSEDRPTAAALAAILQRLREIEGIVFEVRERTPELVA